MKIVKVKSNNIDMVGFEEDYRISMGSRAITRMRVIFSHGGAYDYYRVPKEVYDDFLKADSQGVFFHKNIKKNYAYEKATE
jgi:hypothetical protein